MQKWIKLLKKWGEHAVGKSMQVDEAIATTLISSGFAEALAAPPAKKWYKLTKKWGDFPEGERVELFEPEGAALVEQKMAEAADAPAAPDINQAINGFLTQLERGIENTLQRAASHVTVRAANVTVDGGGRRKSHLLLAGGGTRNDNGPEADYGYAYMGEFYHDVKVASKKGTHTIPERLQSIMEGGTKTKSATVVNGPTPGQKVGVLATGMNETIGEDGGWLVPPTLSNRLMERMFPENDLMGRADVITLTGNSIEFPGLVDDNRATGLRWGGVYGQWLDEAQQKPRSKPKFFQLRMRLHKAAVLVYVTDELLQDSPIALDQWLTDRAGRELRFMAGDAMINGNGVGKPAGILNAPALIVVPAEAGQASKTIVANNISKMWQRLWAPSRANAVWFVNQEIEPQLDTMFFRITNNAGDTVGGFPLYLPQGGPGTAAQVGTSYATLKGRPVIPTEFNPALGAQGDILLVDMSQYMVGTKGGIQQAMSIHLRFDYDETVFRFVFRMDGMPSWSKAVTPYKGTAGVTYSPYVTLAARP